MVECVTCNTLEGGKLFKSVGTTVIRDLNGISFVSVLGFSCCPDTVISGVRAIIVYTLYGILRAWAWTYIVVERLKCVPGYGDSSTTVARVVFVVWVGATLFQAVKYPVFRCVRLSVFLTEGAYSTGFFLEASTATGTMTFKSTSGDNGGVSACTLTEPPCMILFGVGQDTFQDREAMKYVVT